MHRKTEKAADEVAPASREGPEPLVIDQQEYNEGAGPIFVSYREVKGAPSHAIKYSRKLSYVKYFYLIDVHGNETLAAIGEDQGNAFRPLVGLSASP